MARRNSIKFLRKVLRNGCNLKTLDGKGWTNRGQYDIVVGVLARADGEHEEQRDGRRIPHDRGDPRDQLKRVASAALNCSGLGLGVSLLRYTTSSTASTIAVRHERLLLLWRAPFSPQKLWRARSDPHHFPQLRRAIVKRCLSRRRIRPRLHFQSDNTC